MKNKTIFLLPIALLVVAAVTGFQMTYTSAQLNPTEQQETVDAAIMQLFTQTAEAQQQIYVTQTVEAAFNQALTATADFHATVDAGFQQALTATVSIGATPTPVAFPAENLTVADVTEIDLPAGPGRTSAYLSPDGTRFAYYSGESICILSISGEEQICAELADARIDQSTISWSPDGQHLVFADAEFITLFVDSDIWVMDADTGVLNHLTDDEVGRGDFNLLRPLDDDVEGRVLIDLSPHWLANSTQIVFLRYSQAENSFQNPVIYTINANGGEAQRIGALEPAGRFASYWMAAAPDTSYMVYNHYSQGEETRREELWVVGVQDRDPRQLVAELPAARLGLSFSPDSRYILLAGLNSAASSEPLTPEDSASRIVDLDGNTSLVDAERFVTVAGWSPSGSALAYLVRDSANPEQSGLYITSGPGEAGKQVLQGEFIAPVPYQDQLLWASNNTILLGAESGTKVVVVQLE